MRVRDGLYHARGHIIFLAGLLVSFAIILGLEAAGPGRGGEAVDGRGMQALFEAAGSAPVPTPVPLRPDQLAWGRLAWHYFERNIHARSGLPGSVDGFFSTTAWEMGSFLNALVSAERLGVIDRPAFDGYLGKALAGIGRLPLYGGLLPNKSYDVRTLTMTDYNGRASERGIGWSALDIARLMIALEIIDRGYPSHAPAIRAVEARWKLDALLSAGLLMGRPEADGTSVQEGRLGYEEYAAKGLVRAGHDAYRALDVGDTLRMVEVEGGPVPVDGRDKADFDADVCTTSEPFVLEGLELGFDARSRALAWAVLEAQKRRAAATGIPTAVSEGHVPGAPFFVYGCVVGDGVPWAVISPTGERFDKLRFLDTKSVFAWSALFPTPYTQGLLAEVFPLNDPARGWFTGRFEADRSTDGAITANTNAIILESLHFQARGPLLAANGAGP